MNKCLLFVAFCASAAHAQQHGDWTIDHISDERSVYAATLNESGGLLGKVCSADSCRWIMTVKAGCSVNAKYPALLSADAGAWPLTLICAPNEKNPGRYVIQEFDAMDIAVSSGRTLGIAMPLQSGDFRVTRFSINGWSSAYTALMARVQVLLKRPAERTL